MRKLRVFLHTWETRLEKRWQRLSAGKQRKYVILFFAGYLLLTAGVVLTVWHDAKTNKGSRHPATHHIRNPLLQKKGSGEPVKDSSILNNKGYERNSRK